MFIQEINLEGLSTDTLKRVRDDLSERWAVAQEMGIPEKVNMYREQLSAVMIELDYRKPPKPYTATQLRTLFNR